MSFDFEVFQGVVPGVDGSAGIERTWIEAGFVKLWLAHGVDRVGRRSVGTGLDE